MLFGATPTWAFRASGRRSRRPRADFVIGRKAFFGYGRRGERRRGVPVRDLVRAEAGQDRGRRLRLEHRSTPIKPVVLPPESDMREDQIAFLILRFPLASEAVQGGHKGAGRWALGTSQLPLRRCLSGEDWRGCAMISGRHPRRSVGRPRGGSG